MTTTAATWFYREPEHNAYAIQERVRTQFWDERVGNIFLDTVRAEPPFKMQGEHRGSPLEMEWVPNRYLVLRTNSGENGLVSVLSRMLGLKPYLRYDEPDGTHVWEWHVKDEDGQKRWQSIQGIASYRRPERLNLN